MIVTGWLAIPTPAALPPGGALAAAAVPLLVAAKENLPKVSAHTIARDCQMLSGNTMENGNPVIILLTCSWAKDAKDCDSCRECNCRV